MTSAFSAALACLLLTPSLADTSTQVKRFEAVYRGARTLQATFLERYFENGLVVRTEAGVAYFRRPGKMRWEYESPEKNLFLVDGKLAWFYVPADRTVTRVPAKESTDWRTPLALLAGETKLSRICARVDLAGAERPLQNGDVVLSCMLKGSDAKPDRTARNDVAPAKRDTLIFEITQSTGELVRIVLRGSGGVDIEFQFKGWRFDPPVPDSFFRFDVPPGVAIVNGELPSEGKSVK